MSRRMVLLDIGFPWYIGVGSDKDRLAILVVDYDRGRSIEAIIPWSSMLGFAKLVAEELVKVFEAKEKEFTEQLRELDNEIDEIIENASSGICGAMETCMYAVESSIRQIERIDRAKEEIMDSLFRTRILLSKLRDIVEVVGEWEE